MRLHPKLDKEALIAKLKKQGLSNAQIQYAVNDEEKRGDLSKSGKEIRDMKRTVQHEQTVAETSTLDPTRVVATARESDGGVRRAIVRKNLVKEKKPMKEDLETVLTELVEAGYSDDQILEMIVQEANEKDWAPDHEGNINIRVNPKEYKLRSKKELKGIEYDYGVSGKGEYHYNRDLERAKYFHKTGKEPVYWHHHSQQRDPHPVYHRFYKKKSSTISEAKMDRRKVGKVKLTPGKPMTKKQYAEMKAKAMSRKKVKPVAKPAKAEEAPEISGLDLITQHPMNRQIRSVLSTIPKTEHKTAAVNWLTAAIKNHKDNHVQSFVSNPFETMKSILNDRPKKTGPSLPKLKFMGEK
jgi:hypothetical protein